MTAIRCVGVESSPLTGIDLEVFEGEFMILTGPAGSGTSNLLSIMGGYTLPTKGESFLFEENLAKLKPRERTSIRKMTVGAVFQNFGLVPWLSVLDNLIMPLYFSGMPKKACISRAEELLKMMGLSVLSSKKISSLTKGDEEILSIVKASILEPRLLLLDEPTRYLDHPTSVKVLTYLRQLACDQGITVVMALNDSRLFAFAHRIVHLRKGQISEIQGEANVDYPAPPYLQI